MKYASIGSISHGTLRVEDLLNSFSSELEYHIQRQDWSGNQEERDRLVALIDEASNQWSEDGEELENPEIAEELVALIETELQAFAPPGAYFGCLEGDGSDFGFWPDHDSISQLEVG